MKINKEDVFYSLLRLQEYIRNIDDDDFNLFVNNGRPIFSAMLPPKFELLEHDIEKDARRFITKLEFRIS